MQYLGSRYASRDERRRPTSAGDAGGARSIVDTFMWTTRDSRRNAPLSMRSVVFGPTFAPGTDVSCVVAVALSAACQLRAKFYAMPPHRCHLTAQRKRSRSPSPQPEPRPGSCWWAHRRSRYKHSDFYLFVRNFTTHNHYQNSIFLSYLSPAATPAPRLSLSRVLLHKAKCSDDLVVDAVLVIA